MALVLIILSLVWGWIGIFDLGLWIPGVSAGSGFIPTVFSVVTLICSVILLVQAVKKSRGQAPKPATKPAPGAARALLEKYAVIPFAALGILCLQYLGLIPMAFLLVFAWMKLLNRFTWVKSAAIAGAVTLIIYMIFDFWLQVPFPGLI